MTSDSLLRAFTLLLQRDLTLAMRHRAEMINPLCESCHGDEWSDVQCSGSDGKEWKEHLTEGRVSEEVWVDVTTARTGSTCGW